MGGSKNTKHSPRRLLLVSRVKPEVNVDIFITYLPY